MTRWGRTASSTGANIDLRYAVFSYGARFLSATKINSSRRVLNGCSVESLRLNRRFEQLATHTYDKDRRPVAFHSGVSSRILNAAHKTPPGCAARQQRAGPVLQHLVDATVKEDLPPPGRQNQPIIQTVSPFTCKRISLRRPNLRRFQALMDLG